MNPCIVIFEKSMKDRFEKIAKINSLSCYFFDMDNIVGKNHLHTILLRSRTRSELKIKIDRLIDYVVTNNIDEIYFSTAEGYISLNVIISLSNRLASLCLIGLQHGIFVLKKDKKRDFFIKGLNKIFFNLYKVRLLGVGFGRLKLNKYIVYSNAESQFLLDNGWRKDQIEINLNFLKSYLIKSVKENNRILSNQNNASFLLQCLSNANLCDEKIEKELIIKTIHFLSKKYDSVYIKEHPSIQKERVPRVCLPENCFYVGTLEEMFQNSNHVYSFFSTGLIDAKTLGLNHYSIYSKSIKIDNVIYNMFDNVLNFEDEIDVKNNSYNINT